MKKLILVALTSALAALPALAQKFPSQPLRIVVPFAPGGAVDVVTRAVGQRMAEQMGTPLVVENRPGANANIGAEAVAKAAPDGHTLLMGANGLAANMTLYSSLPFDTLRDFAPIARVGYAPLVLVVPVDSTAKSLRDLVAAAKAKPGSLNYGSAGNGGSGHLATELLRMKTGIDVVHVPYKGGSPALTDLVGGRLSFMLINPLEALPHVKSQRVRALAVAAQKRIAIFPDVPTFAEAGLPGYEASVWWGLVAPAKTPPEVVARLSGEALKALDDAGVREKLSALGAVVEPVGSEAFGRFLKAEIDKWAQVIRSAGIKPD